MCCDCTQSQYVDANGPIALPSYEYLLSFTFVEALMTDKFKHLFPVLLRSLTSFGGFAVPLCSTLTEQTTLPLCQTTNCSVALTH